MESVAAASRMNQGFRRPQLIHRSFVRYPDHAGSLPDVYREAERRKVSPDGCGHGAPRAASTRPGLAVGPLARKLVTIDVSNGVHYYPSS